MIWALDRVISMMDLTTRAGKDMWRTERTGRPCGADHASLD